MSTTVAVLIAPSYHSFSASGTRNPNISANKPALTNTDHITLQLHPRATPFLGMLGMLRLSAAVRARDLALREELGAAFCEGAHRTEKRKRHGGQRN